MQTIRKLGTALAGVALLFGAACSQDLNVTNPNNPDVKRALANASDVQSLAVSSVNAWYTGSTARDPWVMFNVTGDLMTMNFGNFGARFNNLEPRIPYANNAANNDIEVSQVPWENEYAALGQANDVLGAVAAGMELPDGTDKYKALALWTQAATLMQLSLIYDKAYTVDETYVPGVSATPKLKPYSEVAAFALTKLDALIALTNGKSWTYTKDEFPLQGGLTAKKLNQFANTMAAQLLAYTPRTAAEAAQVNWAKVLQYANNGITSDFTVVGDANIWWSEFMGYFDLPSWMRIDQKLVHKMAPNVPDHYNGTPVAPSGSYDARLSLDPNKTYHTGTDYVYVGTVIGDPSRGVYMQSPYLHVRYVDVSWQADVSFDGPMPYTLAAENDLLKAEALVRTGGDRAVAAQLVNNTRVTRGQLTPLTAADNDATFMAAITYEREVELNATNGFGFFALRHVDELQAGTVRHLPVPATELETVGLPVYTFGGVGNPVASLAPSEGGLALSLALAPRAGVAKDLELPNGRVMPLYPAVVRHAPGRATMR
jgi:starch-binding outer membrane protein, SusD/RagB family